MAYFGRAGWYLKKDDVNRAASDLSEAIGLEPDFAAALTKRGLLEERRNDLRNARADYAAVLKLPTTNNLSAWAHAMARERLAATEAAAADATQEAFISAYKNLKSFRGGSFKSWLLRIVTNACYDELRRKKRRPAISLDELTDEQDNDLEFDVPSPEDGPETVVQRRELAELIQIGITTLPEDQRVALVLSDVQGLSYDEIADLTNTNLGTVKSRLSRGRAKLREYLQAHGELLPEAYRLESNRV